MPVVPYFDRQPNPTRPIYSVKSNGSAVSGNVDDVINAVLRGEDVRVVDRNDSFRLTPSNFEYSDDEVVGLVVWDTSKTVVTRDGNDIWEFPEVR